MGNKWGDFFSAAEAPPHLVKDTKLLILSLLEDKDGAVEIGLVGKVEDKEETDHKFIAASAAVAICVLIIIVLLALLVKKKRSVKKEPKKLKKKKETETEASDEEDDSTNKKRKEKGKHGEMAKKEEHEKKKEPEKKIVRHGMTKSEYTDHLVHTDDTKLSQYSHNAKQAVMGNKWGDPYVPLPVFPSPRHSH